MERSFNQGIQWKELEEITNQVTQEKQLTVHVYHNADDYLVFKPIKSTWAPKGTVFIGNPSMLENRHEDQSYKAQCERLQKEVDHLKSELYYHKQKTRDIFDAVKDLV